MKLGSGRLSRETGRLLCRIGLAFGVLALLPAGALAGGGGPSTHWVALTGSPGTNTSCASPGYIGVPAVENVILNVASSGDTIHLCSGTWDIAETTGGQGFRVIDKSLTFEGSGQAETIIDGASNGAIAFSNDLDSLDSISLTVRNLTIENAASELPSAISANGGSLTLEDARIRDNASVLAAVGLFNPSGTLTIRRSTLTGPVASESRYEYGLALSVGPVIIEDSTFADSEGRLAGGLILATDQPVGITVNSSTFSNLSSDCASAIYNAVPVPASSLSITNSTVTGNEITGGDCPQGHIQSDGSLSIFNSTFAGNTGTGPGLASFHGLTMGNNILVGDPNAATTCEPRQGSRINSGGNVLSVGTLGCDEFVGGPGPSLQAKVSEASIALDPLALNAPGTTETMALAASSVARGAAIAGDCPATDQRGVTRPANDCDSGAYQYASSGKPKLKVTIGTPRKARAGKNFGITVRTRNVAPAPAIRASSTRSGSTAQSVKTCAKLPKGIFVVKANGGKVKGRTICWTRSSLAPGKTVTYRATVRSSKGRSGKVTVRGTASASNSSGATVRISSSSQIRIVAPRVPDPSPPTG